MTAEANRSLESVPKKTDQPKTALVLAGGGSLGSVQVGMLRALAAHGVRPDLVVGSSVGALNAAHYAGMPTADGVEKLAGIWRSLRRQDVFPITFRGLFGFVRRRDCLVTADGLRGLVETYVPYRNLEEARIPLHVIATDLLSGETVVLSKGPVASAVLASTAIPAAFAPVRIEHRYLADGAITCNTPVNVAAALGAQRLIVLPTGYACALEAPPRGPIATALHALTLLIARQLLHELRGLARTSHTPSYPRSVRSAVRLTISRKRTNSSIVPRRAPALGSREVASRGATFPARCTRTRTASIAALDLCLVERGDLSRMSGRGQRR